MLFQRVNRSSPEKVFIVVKNSYSTASLTNGQAVVWDWTTDKDGVGVTVGFGTNNVSCGIDVAGVAVETIASGAAVCHVFVTGLRGGHSGSDIQENRGNAIKVPQFCYNIDLFAGFNINK